MLFPNIHSLRFYYVSGADCNILSRQSVKLVRPKMKRVPLMKYHCPFRVCGEYEKPLLKHDLNFSLEGSSLDIIFIFSLSPNVNHLSFIGNGIGALKVTGFTTFFYL